MVLIYYRQVFAGKHREATQIGTWKRAAIENMATAFTRRGAAPEQVSAADIDKLHSKIGQLVVERDFLAPLVHVNMHCRAVDASHRLTASGREAKNGEQRS